MRSSPEITLPLELRGEGSLPMQLAAELRRLIGETVLAPGEALPSTRALAAHLGVARGTVVAAYDQLLAEGYLTASTGRSTIVNPQLRRAAPRRARPVVNEPAEPRTGLDLRPGRPATSAVVGPAWKAAWRQASLGPVDVALPPLGLPELREAWADHLRRARAVVRDPGQLAVTGGGREGLALLLTARETPGEYTLRFSTIGIPRPTLGLHRATGFLADWVVGLHPDGRIVERKVRA